jgi:DNA-directed RNA polymerase subunit RPC12/RpoP
MKKKIKKFGFVCPKCWREFMSYEEYKKHRKENKCREFKVKILD